MKNNISKSAILQACMNKQEQLIENFESRVTTTKTDAFSRDHSASQSESRTANNIELLTVYENELAFAKAEYDFLKSFEPLTIKTKAEVGAVVVTNKLTFFISVSVEKVEVDGGVVYGISAQAPIYAAMEGKEKGDKFKYNEAEYEIEDVY
jgi:hypothetical protein